MTRFSPGFIPDSRTAVGALSLTYKQGAFINNSAVAVHTFAAQAVGAAAQDRWVFVLYAAKNTADRVLNGVTIGGVPATIVGRVGTLNTPNTNNGSVGMVYARVPAGTTADIVFTWDAAFVLSVGAGVGIDVYTVVGGLNGIATSSFDSNLNTSPRSWSYLIPKGGVALVIGATSNVTATLVGDLTIDDNGIAYTSGLPRYALSQPNTDNVATLGGSETFTGFASSGQAGPIMGRTFGHY